VLKRNHHLKKGTLEPMGRVWRKMRIVCIKFQVD